MDSHDPCRGMVYRPGAARTIALLTLLALLGGCAFGSKVLEEPQPLVENDSLAMNSDERIRFTLDWVIVRDGPGSWVSKADWDEYVFRVTNLTGEPIQIKEVIVIDSRGTRVEPSGDREQLVESSRKVIEDYLDLGIEVHAEPGLATVNPIGPFGVATAVVGGVALAAASGAVASAAVTAGYGAGVAAGALGGLLVVGVLAVPVVAVGSIGQSIANDEVSEELSLRHTAMPSQTAVDGEQVLHLFFPLAPSPGQVQMRYADSAGEHVLVLDTAEVLKDLHIVATGLPPRPKEPEKKDEVKTYMFDNGAASPYNVDNPFAVEDGTR